MDARHQCSRAGDGGPAALGHRRPAPAPAAGRVIRRAVGGAWRWGRACDRESFPAASGGLYVGHSASAPPPPASRPSLPVFLTFSPIPLPWPQRCGDIFLISTKFQGVAKTAQVIPVYRQLLADHLTPVTAFEVLGREDARVSAGKRHRRREDRPLQLHRRRAAAGLSGGRGHGLHRADRGRSSEFDTTAIRWRICRSCCRPATYHRDKHLPAFTGGLVGYAGYDTIRYYEGREAALAAQGRPPSAGSDVRASMASWSSSITWTRRSKSSPTPIWSGGDVEAAYRDACRRIDDIVMRLQQPPLSALGEIDADGAAVAGSSAAISPASNIEQMVRAGKEYIKAGDIFQFVPSQRLRVNQPADPFDVYRALRIINPSPFMFYLKSPACTLIGSSPEILCRVRTAWSPAARWPGRAAGATARRRRGPGKGAAGRPQGAGRAHHARGPAPQRRGPGGQDRHR